MSEVDVADPEEILARIRTQAAGGDFRITQHAQQEMTEEGISLDEVLQAAAGGQILENYPEHRRGACCLLYCALRKMGVLHEEAHSPRGGFGRGGGPPLPVGPAGRAPRLRRLCKRGSLPRERSVAGGMIA